MSKIKDKRLGRILIIALLLLSGCIPIIDTVYVVRFKNCTKDTLYVGVSYYDNIDSVECQLLPYTYVQGLDTTGVALWPNRVKYGEDSEVDLRFYKEECIAPDSFCRIDSLVLFKHADTCYLFLLKYRDAKNLTWDEIRSKKLYRRRIVTKKPENGCNRIIK